MTPSHLTALARGLAVGTGVAGFSLALIEPTDAELVSAFILVGSVLSAAWITLGLYVLYLHLTERAACRTRPRDRNARTHNRTEEEHA